MVNTKFAIVLVSAVLGAVVTVGCTTNSPTASETPATETAETAEATGTPEASETAEATEASSESAEPYEVFAEDGIAIRGADPVAYFTEAAYVQGSSDFTHEWMGATWQFASAENRDLFAENPEQYAPEYGGFCAWAVSQGYTAEIDPTAWKIVDGSLYLNFDARIQERWAQDIPGNIAKADTNWPGVLSN